VGALGTGRRGRLVAGVRRERAARRCRAARTDGSERQRLGACTLRARFLVGSVCRVCGGLGCFFRRAAIGHDGARECSSFAAALRVRGRRMNSPPRALLPVLDVLDPPACSGFCGFW
jgi:hypothetical protein